MARKTKPKARKTKKAKRSVKRSAKRGSRRAAARVPPRLSREVVEEVLIQSAKSSEGEELSDKALTEIARSAGLDPARLLDAHRRLREAADQGDVTVLRVVEIWEPYEEEELDEEE
jgi:hypothetical protein